MLPRALRTGVLALALALTPATTAIAAPPGASAPVRVDVPSGLRAAPLDVPRTLQAPPGTRIAVAARVPGARFLALGQAGGLLVSQPAQGRIAVVAGGRTRTFASGLRRPHDLVFHRIGDKTWLYVAESHRVTRSVYRPGDPERRRAEVVVDGLPDDSTPELRGRYSHALKNIALDRRHRLHVSIASTCNACVEDTRSDRCAARSTATTPRAAGARCSRAACATPRASRSRPGRTRSGSR